MIYLSSLNNKKRGVIMGKKITVNQVAKLLNCSPLSIRIGLQRGELPFGTAIKTSSKYTYIIYDKKLKEYVNINEVS